MAWAGGLFEGEGCFSTSTMKGRHYLRLRMTSTDKDVLDHFREVIGCGQITQGKVSPASLARTPNPKPHWVWSLSGRLNTYAVGVALFPFLGQRRRGRFEELLRQTMLTS